MNGLHTPHIKINRRTAIALGATLASAAVLYRILKNDFSIKLPRLLKDENSKRGHLVREPLNLGAVESRTQHDILIIGSGISGLSTAYFLEKQGQKNYQILEADNRIGGNSAWGQNDLSAFPLGAHYLPIVRNDDLELLKFLKEIGVITGYKDALPIYNEEYLCGAPHERLFIKGRWQENIIPQYAAAKDELNQLKEFLRHVDGLRTQKGRDGKYVFSIPVENSSRDPEWLKLDQISFRDYLNSKDWSSPYLDWYVDYCCRDDFGLEAAGTSAWAGLHYFASRSGVAANAEAQSVLTWPEGNGFLVKSLHERITQKVLINSTVRRVVKKNDGYDVYYSDAELKTHVIECKKIVYAVPKSVVRYIQPELKFKTYAATHPWLLANIKIKKEALEEKSSLCWDNVRFGSDSLGYVNSCHQILSQQSEFVNITFYHTYSSGESKELRKSLAGKTETDLYQLVITELKKMHPSIEGAIEEVQFKIVGHGMVGPTPNYIWDERLQNIKSEPRDLIFAHTERAGISVFEEGFHQGRAAALRLKGV